MDEMMELAELYTNLYKDRFGVRPRGAYLRAQAEGWTAQDWQDEIDKLVKNFPFEEIKE